MTTVPVFNITVNLLAEPSSLITEQFSTTFQYLGRIICLVKWGKNTEYHSLILKQFKYVIVP
jgi:hypothetical protein